LKQPVDLTKNDFSQQWSTMTYEQRDSFLTKSIQKRSFVNAADIEAVSKACHPALDAGSPEKSLLIIRGLRVILNQVQDAMTYSFKQAFETASS